MKHSDTCSNSRSQTKNYTLKNTPLLLNIMRIYFGLEGFLKNFHPPSSQFFFLFLPLNINFLPRHGSLFRNTTHIYNLLHNATTQMKADLLVSIHRAAAMDAFYRTPSWPSSERPCCRREKGSMQESGRW